MKREEKIREIERTISIQLKLYEERNNYATSRDSIKFFKTLFIGHNALLKLIEQKQKFYEKESANSI